MTNKLLFICTWFLKHHRMVLYATYSLRNVYTKKKKLEFSEAINVNENE